MLVTEEQAKEMWCPEARHDGDGNRWGMTNHVRGLTDNPPECRCIASRCMFWRWQQPTETHHYGTEFDKSHRYFDNAPNNWADAELIESGLGPDGTWRYVIARIAGDPDEDTSWMLGYCGLAGKP